MRKRINIKVEWMKNYDTKKTLIVHVKARVMRLVRIIYVTLDWFFFFLGKKKGFDFILGHLLSLSFSCFLDKKYFNYISKKILQTKGDHWHDGLSLFLFFFYFEKHDGLSHTHNSCYIVMKGTIIYAFPGWMNRTNSYSSSSTTTCRHQDARNSKLWRSHCGLITRFWKRVIKYK